jgi:hypothetical protein
MLERIIYLAGAVGVVGLALVPAVFPGEHGTASIPAHSQTAMADDPWIQDGYPVPMSPEEAGIPPEDAPLGGSLKDGGYYGGSLKDSYSGAYYDDQYYDQPDYYYENTWYEPSYGERTGSYIAQGLSQVPLVLANVFAPQQRTYTTYTTTYVPSVQLTHTYAMPTQQYQIQPVPFQESGQIQALTGTYTPQPQIVTSQQPVNIVQPVQTQQVVNTGVAQITGTVSNVAVPQTIVVPAQTTQASFFAVPQDIARPAQTTNVRVIQATSDSGRIGIAPEGTVKPVCSIQAKPARIAAGGTTVITWSGGNADTATLDPIGPVALVGSSTVKIATTTTFILRLDGALGKASCSAMVSIDPSMCLPGCPPGFVCTPVAATSSAAVPKKSGFWGWLGY